MLGNTEGLLEERFVIRITYLQVVEMTAEFSSWIRARSKIGKVAAW